MVKDPTHENPDPKPGPKPGLKPTSKPGPPNATPQEFAELAATLADLTMQMHELLARMCELEDRFTDIKTRNRPPRFAPSHRLRITNDHDQV